MYPFKEYRIGQKTKDELESMLAITPKVHEFINNCNNRATICKLIQLESEHAFPNKNVLKWAYTRLNELEKEKKGIRESKIQREVVNYAKSKGFIVYRIATADAPDRLFMKGDTFFFIEFKQNGKKPRDRQVDEINRLYRKNIKAFVVDCIALGKGVVDGQL